MALKSSRAILAWLSQVSKKFLLGIWCEPCLEEVTDPPHEGGFRTESIACV
jgi:hypothetical protein